MASERNNGPTSDIMKLLDGLRRMAAERASCERRMRAAGMHKAASMPHNRQHAIDASEAGAGTLHPDHAETKRLAADYDDAERSARILHVLAVTALVKLKREAIAAGITTPLHPLFLLANTTDTTACYAQALACAQEVAAEVTMSTSPASSGKRIEHREAVALFAKALGEAADSVMGECAKDRSRFMERWRDQAGIDAEPEPGGRAKMYQEEDIKIACAAIELTKDRGQSVPRGLLSRETLQFMSRTGGPGPDAEQQLHLAAIEFMECGYAKDDAQSALASAARSCGQRQQLPAILKSVYRE